MSKKLTTEEFINKAKLSHSDKYDYSLVEYTGTKSKVKIICKEHGEFLQRASAHIDGQGCMGCRLENRRTGLDEFLMKSIEVHGDKYNYSLVNEYKNSNTKVSVICQKHGEFKISPDKHLYGQGCAECKKLGLEAFIEKSKLVHGDKYDYSLVKYVNNKEKITIICEEHGIFERRVSDHLSGVGCAECSYDKFRTSTEDFIKKAKIKHNNKYDYPQDISFKSNKEKVEIICKIHGSFFQKVNAHLIGHGCPICKESKGEIEITNFLKRRKINYLPQHKFENCKNINQLSFDFYLPELNICIEFNGRQHYEPVEFFGGIDKFNQQIINDKIKKEYCYNNNIPLIIIKYNENVNDTLEEKFTYANQWLPLTNGVLICQDNAE
jgi:hypothetical protein